jgi:hypothetical protein
MRETTMMRNSKYITMALGAVVLLAGCNSKSPTAPKPTPIPAFNISLTPESSTATIGTFVLIAAQVTSGSGNAPDGTSVTFVVSGGGIFVDDQGNAITGNEVAATTSGGRAVVRVGSLVASLVTVTAGVPGGTDRTHVTFSGVAPTPTPTGPPDYTPQIFALTPNSGPFEGGTRVTISGAGFFDPVQVLFDDIQGQVVSTSYTEVVCISPSITPTEPDTVVTKQVTVTNISNGKVSNGVGFRYGVTMFISSFTPMEGPADAPTTVTIFGQGFVAPVSVEVSAGGVQMQWDVLSVAGTEIVARSKAIPEQARICGDVGGAITVINLGSNQKVTSSQSFTYRATRPLITSVQIDAGGNIVPQYLPGTCNLPWSSHTVTIRGTGFQSGMTVSFGGITPVIATYVDANTLTLTLADLTDITLNEIGCTPGGGGCGRQWVSTPVSVTLNNPRNGCSDTLGGAIVIFPCVTTCRATTLTSVSLSNPGTVTVGTPFVVTATIAPVQTSPTDIALTCNPAFSCPSTVTIPATLASFPITIVATTAVSGGTIFATAGGGSCQILSNILSVTATAPAPTVTSVNPNTGPAAGSTAVTITGTGFVTGATVTFGGNGATNVTVVNATTITCDTPAGAAGAVNVVVTNPDLQTGTLTNGFTYT